MSERLLRCNTAQQVRYRQRNTSAHVRMRARLYTAYTYNTTRGHVVQHCRRSCRETLQTRNNSNRANRKPPTRLIISRLTVGNTTVATYR